ncbi:MAG: tRNA (adenosine(37)-N6)-threonylcarbamoyltransferase complex ATPase subunit type 1 TsaE [Oscillospiraceae bacterium]|jgi:tRNA threonylcarbamoyladenosine biosynthesis protein TsaE|nr:tRNA (adenosine(37)-N6)-threonylcarbamoyltransferase complex ATPase subunit type 1 TsaE [Oscillospiraceae bacterium]
MTEYESNGVRETEQIAAVFADRLRTGDVVAFCGGLGAGKTAFVRGLARGLACLDDVSSPTYALVHEHQGKIPLAHFDMYRVETEEALESTGFYDYLAAGYVLAIEWSENVPFAVPQNAWRVTIQHGEHENQRKIRIEKEGSQC